MKKWKWSVLFVMALCIERGISQVNKLHLGRDLSRVSDFVLKQLDLIAVFADKRP